MSSTSFKVGDSVRWESQAAGSWKSKVGTVHEVVPPGQMPVTHLGSSGLPRKRESYVIHVPSKSGRGKGTFYWPVATVLEPA